jgi:hypothetical protein
LLPTASSRPVAGYSTQTLENYNGFEHWRLEEKRKKQFLSENVLQYKYAINIKYTIKVSTVELIKIYTRPNH